MFHHIIREKSREWVASPTCPAKALLDYIAAQDKMRDAQIEAIETYLFLKIAHGNKPLHELFSSGALVSSATLDDEPLKTAVRDYLKANPATVALREYARATKSAKLLALLEDSPEKVDAPKVLRELFYGVTYTDYIFSLPMGAGKTFLMAAFIYLDLYFAQNEPDNKAFAHNFIIFAPSGLKSSVIPSLKTIQNFDPAWIIPEPAAGNLKRQIQFEVLDQSRSAAKSNRAKNPNVQKIAAHQPLDQLIGLVAVTNAEKVILDRIKVEDGTLKLFEDSSDERDRQANELRNLIGKLPNLAIYIDEVHHVADEDIKLRGVVNKWMRGGGSVNSVVGFSGTPYLQSPDSVQAGDIVLKSSELSNVVYYYPLIAGIGNFLKNPTVKISTRKDSVDIVKAGVRDFLSQYKNKTYANGLTAKLGIYCGRIETLEETIFPVVAGIVQEFGLDPGKTLLKYHKGNKTYKISQENETEFASLDTPVSKKRIVLLVLIGKEGWDCRSLTGIILSQKGDCPTNMVLQTSCRCLRQVDKGQSEPALIWLNEFNADKLNAQLKEQQHITIDEFQKAKGKPQVDIERFSRLAHLKLPPVKFFQLRVRYDKVATGRLKTKDDIAAAASDDSRSTTLTKTQDLQGTVIDTAVDQVGGGDYASFNQWQMDIAKESFGFVTTSLLNRHRAALLSVFNEITRDEEGSRHFRADYDQDLIRSRIRQAFYEKRTFKTKEEVIPDEAKLLRIENLTSPLKITDPESFHPVREDVAKIIAADSGKLVLDKKTARQIKELEKQGDADLAAKLQKRKSALPERENTYHYLPYHLGSGFELKFLKEIVTTPQFKDKGLEIYYNGDRGLTDFKISCFKGGKGKWKYIGQYTPDFLILSRKAGKIHKVIIVETKGAGFSVDKDFVAKKDFLQTEFLRLNEKKFKYSRFDYLYLEDSLDEGKRIEKAVAAIDAFFAEKKHGH